MSEHQAKIRVLDITAEPDGGFGIFEKLSGFETGDAFARHLNSAVGRSYGTPAVAFLSQVVTRPPELRWRRSPEAVAAYLRIAPNVAVREDAAHNAGNIAMNRSCSAASIGSLAAR